MLYDFLWSDPDPEPDPTKRETATLLSKELPPTFFFFWGGGCWAVATFGRLRL